MVLNAFKEVRKVYASVNAEEIRALAGQDLSVGLLASSETGFRAMEDFLGGSLEKVHRLNGMPTDRHDFIFVQPGLAVPPNGFEFDPANPAATLEKIVNAHHEKELTIARSFPGFRRTVAEKIIHRI